jgi:hypothetical protein
MALSPFGEINILLDRVKSALDDAGSRESIARVYKILESISYDATNRNFDLQKCQEENERLRAELNLLKAKLAPKEAE